MSPSVHSLQHKEILLRAAPTLYQARGDFQLIVQSIEPVGVGNLQHLVEGVTLGHASAVLAASIFHFGEYTIGEAKAYMQEAGVPVRI